MTSKVEGIIVKEMPYQETHKIITILTKEYGKIGVLARGAKKVKSKFSASTQLFTHGNFYIVYKESGLSTLTQVEILNSFSNIKQDIKNMTYASIICELSLKASQDHTNEVSIYNLLSNSLYKIDDGFDSEIISFIFEIKTLNALGVQPNVDSCANCNSTKNIVSISTYHGGYLCSNCISDKIPRLSPKTLKVFRQLYYIDIEKLNSVNLNIITKKELRTIINEYYDVYTGIYLKSKSFLNHLNKL